MAQHHEKHTMSDPTISDEPMVDPDVTAIIYAESTAETMNHYYAEEGIAYPVSGDYLANWDGRGPASAAERRLKRLAAPAIKYVLNTILDAREDLQLHFEMIDSDPRMTARIRNGHPATPRKQLLHNGRKPK